MSGGSVRPINQFGPNMTMLGLNPLSGQGILNPFIQGAALQSNTGPGMGMNMPINMFGMSQIFNHMGMPVGGMMNMMGKSNLPTNEFRKVWVGRIPPDLSDTFIFKLLETCGSVASWKRTTDQNGRPKGFGFCEYHTVESMLKCLRLLNNLKLEEGYELSIKVDSKTEEFLKQWREQKKNEWIENLRRRGIDVNLDDIKKRENNREPLEWELQLISKDNDTRKLIFEILTQKNDIELYAKQSEKPEEFLKDLKDLTHSNTFSAHLESEREKERFKRKQEKIKKNEKQYKEDEKRWERHEEDRDRERKFELHAEEELKKKKRRLIEKDLHYNSEEEKKKIKSNPKKAEEYRQMREKEKELDNIMRKSEKGNFYEPDVIMNDDEKALVPLHNEVQVKEPEAKTMVIYKEYNEEEEDEDTGLNSFPKIQNMLSLNLDTKKIVPKQQLLHEEEDNGYDPYEMKKVPLKFEINPETEKEILEMRKEVINFEVEEKSENKKENIVGKKNITVVPAEIKKILREISEMIPKNKDDVLKYPINWNIVYKYDILETKIKPWLGKKLEEYLGEDEPNLKAMIVKKLTNKSSPYEIMEKIRVVFEDDTDEFILKLWKNFIFEILRAQKLNENN